LTVRAPVARLTQSVALAFLLAAASASAVAQQPRDTIRLVAPDTIVATLVASDTTVRPRLRLCAGGDITLGSNLDSLWARNA
jgi:hypothetical protein